MSDIRIATRYAKSVIELAQEKGVLEAVHNDMQMFNEVVNENSNLELALKNPIISPEKKNAILRALFPNVNGLTKSFFDIVTKKNRADVLPLVSAEFHRQYNKISSIQVAKVVTATPLDEKLRKEFIRIVKNISKREKVELTEKVDQDIIGGYVLTVDDKQIDASIKSKLGQLRRDMTKNQYVKEF